MRPHIYNAQGNYRVNIFGVDSTYCPLTLFHLDYRSDNDYKINSIDVRSAPELIKLEICDEEISNLNVGQNKKLKYLWCDRNQITNLNLSNNPLLVELSCHSNNLEYLDLSNNHRLFFAQLGYNNIANLDVSPCPALSTLECANCELININVSNNPVLYNLIIPDNKLTSLNVSTNSILNSVWCYNNALPLSVLYAIWQRVQNKESTLLGTQTLPTQSVEKNMEIDLSANMMFEGIPTVFTAKKETESGDIATAEDYTLSNGKLTFHTAGTYIVEMTNEAIRGDEYITHSLAKVLAPFTVTAPIVAIIDVSAQNISLYPNPAKHDLYIQSDTPVERVELYNQTGQRVLTEEHVVEKIDVSNLEDGFYFVRVTMDGVVVTKKVIVKK
jgi:hypothetical protein